MDIEKIMKINEMTKTLKAHGMIQNKESNSDAAQELMGEKLPEQKDIENINKEQVLVYIERNSRAIMNTINSLKEEIDNLRYRICELEKKPAQVIEKQISISSPHEPVVREMSQPMVQNNNCSQNEHKKENHARGDPRDIHEDVSIEKMFYYGKKK